MIKKLLLYSLILCHTMPLLSVDAQKPNIEQSEKKPGIFTRTKKILVGVGLGIAAAVALVYTASQRVPSDRLQKYLALPSSMNVEDLASENLFSYNNVRWLLDNGLNVNATDTYNGNMLIGIYKESPSNPFFAMNNPALLHKVAKLLIDRKIDVNKQDNFGRTAAIYIAWSCDADMLKILLEAKPDLSIKDYDGNDAYHISKFFRPSNPINRGMCGRVGELLEHYIKANQPALAEEYDKHMKW